MNDMDKQLKSYFEEEVSQKTVPPFREKKAIFKMENLFLAACVLGSLVLVAQPAIYDNRIRRSYIPMSKFEAFKENFPRVIFEGSQYFKEKQGGMIKSLHKPVD